MSADTPRTDAQETHTNEFFGMRRETVVYVPRNFACTLERELAANAAELVRVRAERDKAVEDTKRIDWLERSLSGCKWADTLPHLRPEDEKYVRAGLLRPAIDAALRAAVPGTG